CRRNVELSDTRRAAGAPRPDGLLARPSGALGEHQHDQGDRALVQSELHPEDERREDDGNPREPHADTSAARVSQAVSDKPQETFDATFPSQTEPPTEESGETSAAPPPPISETPAGRVDSVDATAEPAAEAHE